MFSSSIILGFRRRIARAETNIQDLAEPEVYQWCHHTSCTVPFSHLPHFEPFTCLFYHCEHWINHFIGILVIIWRTLSWLLNSNKSTFHISFLASFLLCALFCLHQSHISTAICCRIIQHHKILLQISTTSLCPPQLIVQSSKNLYPLTLCSLWVALLPSQIPISKLLGKAWKPPTDC